MTTAEVGSQNGEGARFWLSVCGRGMLMGVAELIPGISGGTIAFISGVYGRMIAALSSLDSRLAVLLYRWLGGKATFAQLIHHADGIFLLALFGGMGGAILLSANLIHYLLNAHEIPLWSFFCGLIIGSFYLILLGLGSLGLRDFLAIAVGAALGVALILLPGFSLGDSTVGWILAGFLASAAWMLPGVSGSFILLLLGVYPSMMRALAEFSLRDLLPLALGVVIGMLVFARILRLFLHFHRRRLMLFLAGLMLGSVYRIWPWQKILSYQFIEGSALTTPLHILPLWPDGYYQLTGEDPQILAALSAAALGLALVLFADRRWNTEPL